MSIRRHQIIPVVVVLVLVVVVVGVLIIAWQVRTVLVVDVQ